MDILKMPMASMRNAVGLGTGCTDAAWKYGLGPVFQLVVDSIFYHLIA